MLGLSAVVTVLVLVLLWLPANDELTAGLMAEAEEALGVPVRLGTVRWQLFPLALVIGDAATVQPEPIRVERIELRPRLRELWRQQLTWLQVRVQAGEPPQPGLRTDPAPSGNAGEPLVKELRFHRLTSVTRDSVPLVFDGHLHLDADGRPRQGEVTLLEAATPTRLAFRRLGEQDRWRVDVQLGGGASEGEVALAQPGGGSVRFTGRFELRQVEVHSALAALHRRSVVRGQLTGQTELGASGTNFPELLRSLHTRTRFTLAPATLLGIDVDKAIRTLGRDRAGQTQIASLTGEVETHSGADGMIVRYRELEARGNTFSARGGGTIAGRQVNADLTVALVGSLVGVPLKVSGPLSSPEVSVRGLASARGALGSGVLPGIEAALRAGVGAAIGKLLGGGEGEDAKSRAAPRGP